ncbi:MAG: type II toxin-antitoxin system VapC family toxin [Anaerolineae bacterium]|nr:type II toxin-antitoxin system VapC family toxin [Anaerolineae bacterium]
MTVYFCDTSALAKRYSIEQGSVWIQGITAPSARNRIFIAQITPVEIVSALARKEREKTLTSRSRQAAMLLLERHGKREYVVVRFTDSVAQEAKRLLITYPLRAFDAIQLASAITANRGLLGTPVAPLIYLASDKQLQRAAIAEGLQVDDPNNYP